MMAAGTLAGAKSRANRAETAIAVAAVSIVFMLVVPLPHWALDMLLALNITLALGILMVTFQVKSPLEFSSFPSLLLLVTLFRLALNVSATRLILGTGEAGLGAPAFGFVGMRGHLVVRGLVVRVLAVVHFVGGTT